ncbi:MAG: MoxR family ATPase [Phycisphaerales bacterium]|nr:MoxR family ATPase [Phycisphaerales bacterium]
MTNDTDTELTAFGGSRAAGEVQQACHQLRTQISKVIVGQEKVVDQILVSMFCRGHALVIGVPGLAKTLMISTIAQALSLRFSRIQFTPDLMPSDITGTELIQEDKHSGTRELRFVKGPLFANVILADEINRTPPKTQSALLEAMQERHVTAGGVQHELPKPFFVLATQNPIEQEGTYPLPEAQLDRFMFSILIGYPDEDDEVRIIQRTTAGHEATAEAVLGRKEIQRVAEVVREVPVAEHVIRYALRLVRATRVGEDGVRPSIVDQYVRWGAGPRAGQFLILAAKATSILAGSAHVTPEHIRAAARPVLRHRIITNFNAEADGVSSEDVITALLDEIPIEGTDRTTQKQMDTVLKR